MTIANIGRDRTTIVRNRPPAAGMNCAGHGAVGSGDMKLLGRAALMLGMSVLVLGAYAAWYVYGAWPVPDGYEFPRHSLWGGGPGALFEGSLADQDGCIVGIGPNGAYTVVWPPGYSLGSADGQPVVRGGGREVRMGEQVRMGGGYPERRSQLRAIAGGAADTRCPEPYFLSTGFID
jgi:hypothetical protein